MKKLLASTLIICALVFAGCKKNNPNANQWILGNSVYKVNAYSNYDPTGTAYFGSFFQGTSQGPECKFHFYTGSHYPSTGSYALIVDSTSTGVSITVTDSANRIYTNKADGQSASFTFSATSYYHPTPGLETATVPTIWLYNVARPSDSLRFSATLNYNL